jgi:hypothetical protein
MRLLFVVALLLPVVLFAQGAFPNAFSGGGWGGATPVSEDLLIHAYNNMMAGNYTTAEQQYRELSFREPNNLSAWEGLLWAYNAQGKLKVSLKLSAKLIKQYPDNASFFNYRAYPLLVHSRYPEARYYYQKAYKEQRGNLMANQISQEGLAYTYQGLGDYPRHYQHLNASSALSGIPAPKPRLGFRSTVAYVLPDKNKSSISFSQGISYKSWRTSIGYEDFSLEKQHFRSISSASLSMQFKPFDIKAGASLLDGIDERIYPAQQYSAELTPKLYLGKIVFYPSIMGSFSHYPRFDVQQLSFLPQLMWRDININYAAHYSFMDNETVNADSTRFAQQVLITKSLPMDVTLGLHYGNGDYCWMVDASGTIMDTFNQQSAYYGVSLLIPFFNRFSVYAYHNRQDERQLWYASLTVRY